MKKTMVINKRSGQPYDLYIGRPSKWGNPFSHLNNTIAKFKVSTRDEAIRKYEEWVVQQPELMAALPEIEGKILACWCDPLPCHGHVLVNLLEQVLEQLLEQRLEKK